MGVSETTTRIIIPHPSHCILRLITLPTLSYSRRDSSYIPQPSDAHVFLSPLLLLGHHRVQRRLGVQK